MIFAKQWAMPIDINESWNRTLEQPVLDAIMLPSIYGKCKTLPLVHYKSIGRDEVSQIVNRIKNNDSVASFENYVYSIKAKEILLSVLYICGLIYKRYKRFSEVMGKPLNSENFRQIIELPIMMEDLYPGDTAIVYKVFTKRKLEYIGK